MFRQARIVPIAIFLLTFIPLLAGAQQVVRVSGMVIDGKSKEPIPDVQVTAYMRNRPNSKFTTTTDKSGKFIITRLGPGMAVFEFARDGYKPFLYPKRLSSTAVRISFTVELEKIERQAGTVTQGIRGRYDEATVLFQEGKLDESLVIFRELLDSNPDLHAIHINVGIILTQKEDFDAALEHFNTALEQDAENADILIYKAEVYLKMEDYDEALIWYRNAADVRPDFYWAVNQTADVARFLNNYDVAVDYYRKAVALDSSKPLPHLYLGTLLEQQKGYDEALTHLLAYIDLDPAGAVSHAKGMIEVVIEEHDSAEEYFRQAVAEDESKPLPHFYLGKILAAQAGSEQEALRLLNKYLELDSDNTLGEHEAASELIGALQ